MAAGTSNFGELLWPGIKEIWGESYNQWPEIYSKFFEVSTSDKAFEKFQGAAGLGLAAIKNQGDSISYADPLLSFQKIIEPVTYAIGSSVTLEMYEDDQYNFINKIPKMLSNSVRHTEEVVTHGLLNNAFSGSFLGADGKSLCATDHPLADGSGTYSNTPTVSSDLSQTALENAEIAINGFTDDRGLKIYLKGVKLIVPTASQFIAQKILETKFEVDTANNTTNPIEGRYIQVTTPFLTDPDAWFLKTDCDNGLMFLRRRKPTIDRDNQFDTLNLRFQTHTRFGVGFVNPRCIYGSPGAA